MQTAHSTRTGYILMTLIHIVTCQINFQSISVHKRFDTELYDHIYTCHYCTENSDNLIILWRQKVQSLGGFGKSHSRGRVFSNYRREGPRTLANSSILLYSGNSNNTYCLSSLLIGGSTNSSLNGDYSCNDDRMFTVSSQFSENINHTQSTDGYVMMDYVFAVKDVISAYTLHYHGIICRTKQTHRQIWKINNHTFELTSTEITNRHFNDANGIGYTVVSVSLTDNELTSFLSVSYVSPRTQFDVISCSNTINSTSIYLMNISFTPTTVPDLVTASSVANSTTALTSTLSSQPGFSVGTISEAVQDISPTDTSQIILAGAVAGVLVGLCAVIVLILVVIVIIRGRIAICCPDMKIAPKLTKAKDEPDGAEMKQFTEPPIPARKINGAAVQSEAVIALKSEAVEPERPKFHRLWSLEEGEETGNIYCTYQKDYKMSV